MAGAQDELRSYTVPNLIQGVSQQAPQNRRDSQCESQFDCVNSPVLGCEARPPLYFRHLLSGKNYATSFFYEIRRGTTEHYIVVVSTAGVLEVYNVDTGALCSNTIAGGVSTYLTTAGEPRDVLRATTVNDNTFIVNREKVPAMSGSSISPPRPNNAIVYFKAGGYMITYQLSVTIGGHVYIYEYTTPDSSVIGNAQYIPTNVIAAAFYKVLTGVSPPITATGAVATPSNQNVGPVSKLDPASVGATTTILDLDFTALLMGNVILISRADGAPFTLDCGDGNGDVMMFAVKDSVQAFANLPKNCFSGFTTKVKGSNNESEDDYWVTYGGAGDGAAGQWEETVAPSTPLTFDPTTMPIRVINTVVNTFTTGTAPWGNRVAGDSTTSPDPSFVGRPIKDIAYDHNRLAIMVEGSTVWSKTNNPFVYFPSSKQTTLATDPVDMKVAAGKQIALLDRIVQASEQSFLWAPKVQFRITINAADSFRQETVEAKPLTSFEYSTHCDPLPLADSLYFPTDVGLYVTIREFLASTTAAGLPPDITAHVKKYIPAGMRRLGASDTLSTIFAQTDGAPTNLFIYNYLIGASDSGQNSRLQSAWSTWRLPPFGSVLWFGISSNMMDLMIQRPEGVFLCRIDLGQDVTDDGHTDYLTRMDYRVDESQGTSPLYDATTDTSSFVLPFHILEDSGAVGVVQRTSSAVAPRGNVWPVTSVSGNLIHVRGDIRSEQFYVGLRIIAERTESEFHLHGPSGLVSVERLQIVNAVVSHSDSMYYRAEVTYATANLKTGSVEMTGRNLGSSSNRTGQLSKVNGKLKIPVQSHSGEYTLRLVNDSFFPSRWQTLEYQYITDIRARPSRQQ